MIRVGSLICFRVPFIPGVLGQLNELSEDHKSGQLGACAIRMY